jgi:spore coat polysaccharide biosynthesis protein SpsF
MHVAAIIQARMGSTRLPGKVLTALGGATVLSHVVNRLKRAGTFDSIVVATSTLAMDDAVVAEAYRLGAQTYRGSEIDVLGRYYEAATEIGADAVARITADCPVIDPGVVAAMVRAFKSGWSGRAFDLMTNARRRTFPRGMDVEVFSLSALSEAHNRGLEPYHREHVTPYLYEHPDRFRILDYLGERDLSHLRLTLDTTEDLELLKRIFDVHGASNPAALDLNRIVQLLDEHPCWISINAHIKQKSYSKADT